MKPDSPLRVLITGPALADPGGVASYYNALLPALRAMPGLQVEYLEIGSTARRLAGGQGGSDYARFSALLTRFRPQLVHLNPSLDPRSVLRDGALLWIARLRRIPVVVLFHGWNMPFDARIDRLFRWPFRFTFGYARQIQVLASAFSRRLARWGVRSPVSLVTTLVDPQLVAGVAKLRSPAPRDPAAPLRVLFLSRLDPAKGARHALEAVALLQARGVPVHLTVAGNGPDMPQVQAFMAAHPHLKDRIDVAGDVRGERKLQAFASHDVYCFPSTYGEGMPTSVLEAMACGMAVVTSLAGGLADFFEDGRMGAALKDVTAESVADALQSLHADRSHVARVSSGNRDYAAAHFMPQGYAPRLAEVYARAARSQD